MTPQDSIDLRVDRTHGVQTDRVAALKLHRRALQQEADRLAQLLKTIEKTISRLTEGNVTMTDEELYEGCTTEQVERYTREVNERYDPKIVAESYRRVRRMSKEQWKAVGAQGEEVNRQIAGLMHKAPGDPAVQAAVARHYAWLENFYHATAAMYRGVGQGYAEHSEFRAFYEKYQPGLAGFMCAAMTYYADHTLAE